MTCYVKIPILRRPAPCRKRALDLAGARNLVPGLVELTIVMVFATASYVAAGCSLGDALDMVIVTISTVGEAESARSIRRCCRPAFCARGR